MEDITPQIEEFRLQLACRCGCGSNRTSSEFAGMLYFAQGVYGKLFTIDSGARCPKHNAWLGGDPDSASLYGEHADLAFPTPADLFLGIKALIGAGFERFMLYPRHLHVDRHPKWPIPRFAWANYPPKIKKEV
ncbi:D-Ala-D-Ala carboxypeptidase family metallohydrolase [Patescibacteria group bacterium]|nr:D-Ala-D-Ala carboxypeptidase family metallohydrolase [Patescibacteria group bacterium]